MANQIKYIKGDATCPQAKGTKLIVHICNDMGGWGKGFVLAISKRWKEPEARYREWYNNDAKGKGCATFELGATQCVQVLKDTYVCNMIAQHGMKTGSNGPPIRYDALTKCLVQAAIYAQMINASIHAPRIGCSLGGGSWAKVEEIINITLIKAGIEVFIYDVKDGSYNH